MVGNLQATPPMSRHTEVHVFKSGIVKNLASEHLRVIDNVKEWDVTSSRSWAQTKPWLGTSLKMEMRTVIYGMEKVWSPWKEYTIFPDWAAVEAQRPLSKRERNSNLARASITIREAGIWRRGAEGCLHRCVKSLITRITANSSIVPSLNRSVFHHGSKTRNWSRR